MTVELLAETAATGGSVVLSTTELSATALKDDPFGKGSKRTQLLLAGFVLSVAITGGSVFAAQSTPVGRHRREDASESGTALTEVDPALVCHVREIFEQGADEFFEDGMESRFSRALVAFVTQNGRESFRALANYLFSNVVNPDVTSEALRWLGDLGDATTLPLRWSILARTLRHPSPRVRDGAVLGFAAIDDARARPLLEEARETEQVAELRRLMNQVLDQVTHAAAAQNRTRE